MAWAACTTPWAGAKHTGPVTARPRANYLWPVSVSPGCEWGISLLVPAAVFPYNWTRNMRGARCGS